MNPKLYMLIGLPGSGKSTWINSFLQKSAEDFVVISSDNIIEELGNREGLNYQEAFKKFAGKATSRMKQEARQALNNNQNIIWDQTNLTVKSRRSKLENAKGYDKIAVNFIISEPELNRRLEKREQEVGKKIPDFVMKNMAASYIAPSKNEGFAQIINIRD